jgi:histidine ammonia-lyase
MKKVVLSTSGLKAEEVLLVARGNAQVEISPEAISAMAKTREHIEKLANSEEPVYGISTGFGALAQRHIPRTGCSCKSL